MDIFASQGLFNLLSNFIYLTLQCSCKWKKN